MVRKDLEECGWICEEAENGVDAIAKARATEPNIIILDLAMPVMNGYDAAIVLNRELPNVPLVMLTSYGDVLRNCFTKTSGIKDVVPKSKGMSALIESI